MQIVRVVDPHEVRLVDPLQRDAGGAVRLIADHQIERRYTQLLRIRNDRQRLVGREHHRQALGTLAMLHLVYQRRRVRGHWDRHVVGVDVLRRAGHLRVRADSERTQVQLRLRRPLPQRLTQQRDRRNREQNPCAATVLGCSALGDLERGERLAGAARHDQLAAVVAGGETREHLLDRGGLMRTRLVTGRFGDVDLQVAVDPGDVPVDRRVSDLRQADPLHRDGLILESVLSVLSPPIGGGDDDPVRERVLARRSEERIDVLLAELVRRLVELALDRRVLTTVPLAGDEVDSGVGLAFTARPVDPPPHFVVLLRQQRIKVEVADHELLELGPAFRVRRRFAERVHHLVDRTHNPAASMLDVLQE